MKINLIYNNYNKYIDINILEKNGVILNKLLNNCSLLIYNIESCNIIMDDTFYLLGINEASFDITFEEFLNNINKNQENINKIEIYDRKRDINGNVIKDNITIENYNKWYQNYESENFINIFNQAPSNENSQIIRFPITSFLDNILNIPLNTLTPSSSLNIFTPPSTITNSILSNNFNNNDIINIDNNINENANSTNINQNLNINDTFITQNLNINENVNINNISIHQDENINNENENENIIDNNNINSFPDNINNDRPVGDENTQTTSMNQFNNLIDIIDNYLRDTEHLYINEVMDTLDNLNNVILNDDVKIVLNEEEYQNLERINYVDSNKELECLICLDTFENNETLVKINCNHLFHCNCIKNWVCNESNKCPVCRIEIGKGTPI